MMMMMIMMMIMVVVVMVLIMKVDEYFNWLNIAKQVIIVVMVG